ncbi:hypothetical protein SAMN05660380_01284 [Xylella fastidiosa]|jgi:hypothetical protein|nr:hypothetical protein SAMN05660380_01284 [Xylella fastidiosa]
MQSVFIPSRQWGEGVLVFCFNVLFLPRFGEWVYWNECLFF